MNMLNIKDDQVSSIIAVKKFENFLFMATKKGHVKKMALETFSKPRSTGVRAINLPLDAVLSGVESFTVACGFELNGSGIGLVNKG